MTNEVNTAEVRTEERAQGQQQRRRRRRSGAPRGNRQASGTENVTAAANHNSGERRTRHDRRGGDKAEKSGQNSGDRERKVSRHPRKSSRRDKSETSVKEVREILMPSADVIQEFEYALEGSGARLMEMAEAEQQHRHDWEAHYLKSQIKSQRIGQLFGVLMGIAAIIGVLTLANDGQELAAAVLAGSVFAAMTVSGLVGSALQSRKKRYRRAGR